MALTLLIFAEAAYDAFVVECLTDRALAEDPQCPAWIADGLDAGNMTHSDAVTAARQGARAWVDESTNEVAVARNGYWDLHSLSDRADELRRAGRFRTSRGRFDGEPGNHSAKLGRKALDLAAYLARKRALDAVILAQDMDTDPSRRDGLHQARCEAAGKGASFEVVLACPIQCAEAWVIAALEPEGPDDDARHKEVGTELGFDPCTRSHVLHHDHRRADGVSAVLWRLTDGDWELEERALRTTALQKMKDRGEANGLRQFLDEATIRVGPLLRSSG